MDKLCEAKLRGSNELPSYSHDWQRGSLCCRGARPNLFHAAENPRNTSHIQPERVRITHGPERLGAASSTDLVCWRTLNLHISIVFIIFSRRATTLTQGPFVSVFFFFCSVPQTLLTAPTPPLFPSEHIWLPLLLKNTTVSMVLFSASASVPFCFQLWPELGTGLCRRVPPSRKFVSLCSGKAKPPQLTSHFAAHISSMKSPWHDGTPARSWNIFRLMVFVCWSKLKHDCPHSPSVDGWIVIRGQGCW